MNILLLFNKDLDYSRTLEVISKMGRISSQPIYWWRTDTDLTDEQWAILAPLIPQKKPRADGKGRPRLNNRTVLDGILWILRTGAAWQDLPGR